MNGANRRRWLGIGTHLASVALLFSGCSAEPAPPEEVVVYTAIDSEVAEPIFAEFTKATGILVRPKYDTEATKPNGLAEAILAERERPRCDLFWNDEMLHTLRLEREGLLRPYASPAAADFPSAVRSPQGLWYGLAARARVIIVNTHQVAEARRPETIYDLTDPQWYDRVAIAKPLFGTTATHAACLFQAWGDERAGEFLRKVKGNAQILSDNKQVARAVSSGKLAFGLTDSDDAVREVEAGMPVAIIYPDQGDGELGTLFIPNTLALIKDSPHPRAAEKLLDYMLSAEVERRLAEGPSAQVPLRAGVPSSDRVKTPEQVRTMAADFPAAAAEWDSVDRFLQAEFGGGK